MRIYCDTNTLFHNIRGTDRNVLNELDALRKLLDLRALGKILMFRSRVALGEVTSTANLALREELKADFEKLDQLPNDEKLLGFNTVTDQYGGVCRSPLVSDVQDEKLCKELYELLIFHLGDGNERKRLQMHRDAQHLTQAVANRCDVFLTRDEQTIVRPLRKYLQSRFDGFKVRLPSELIAQIDQERAGCMQSLV